MRKLKSLPEFINGFRVVEDLGMLSVNNNKPMVRFAVVLCKECKNEFKNRSCELKRIQSCGCKNVYPKEIQENRRLIGIYYNMISRCYDNTMPSFKNYGGRGISVCDDWKSSKFSFISWAILSGHMKSLSLDRIDNDSNYSPENCRWVTRDIQSQNSRKAKLTAEEVISIRENIENLTSKDLAKKYKVLPSTINRVLRKASWKNI